MGICETYLDDMDEGFSEAKAHWVHLVNIVNWMDDWYEEATEENWRINVKGALRHCEGSLSALIYGNDFPTGIYRIPYFLRYCLGEISMAAILSTMVLAEPDEIQYFVGLVDAYRQSIWNKPFNREFFAALARGFEQWA